MSKFTDTFKDVVNGGIKLINRAATSVADSTRFNLNKMENTKQQRETMNELGAKVYELFKAGVELPEDLLPLLNELRALEEGLVTMVDERTAQLDAAKEQRETERAARAEERAAAKAAREEARAAAQAAAAAVEAQEVESALDAIEVEDGAPVLEVVEEAAEETIYDGAAPTLEVVAEDEAKNDDPAKL